MNCFHGCLCFCSPFMLHLHASVYTRNLHKFHSKPGMCNFKTCGGGGLWELKFTSLVAKVGHACSKDGARQREFELLPNLLSHRDILRDLFIFWIAFLHSPRLDLGHFKP